MKQRIVILCLVFALACSITGCSSTKGTGNNGNSAISNEMSGGNAKPSNNSSTNQGDTGGIWGESRFNRFIPPATSEQFIKNVISSQFNAMTEIDNFQEYLNKSAGTWALNECKRYSYYASPTTSKPGSTAFFDKGILQKEEHVDPWSNEVRSTLFQCDEQGNVLKRESDGYLYEFEYDENGIIIRETINGEEDVFGEVKYDNEGKIISYIPVQHFAGEPWLIGDMDIGRIYGGFYDEWEESQFTSDIIYNQDNHIIQYLMFNMEYEGDKVVKVIYNNSIEYAIEYDDNGNVVSITSNDGSRLRFEYIYDTNGNILLERCIDDYSINAEFFYSYDLYGNRILESQKNINPDSTFEYMWENTNNGEKSDTVPDVIWMATKRYYDASNTNAYVSLNFTTQDGDVVLIDLSNLAQDLYGKIVGDKIFVKGQLNFTPGDNHPLIEGTILIEGDKLIFEVTSEDNSLSGKYEFTKEQ